MSARLVLSVGSRAGLEAPLQVGYYMIGRHKECQIRPKSRSVSRRHCLLHHGEQGLKVMDLNSSAGSYVNNSRLEPKRWYPLKDESELRCGKVLFQAGVCEEPLSLTPASEAVTLVADGGSIVRGDAWHDVDVAGFLDSEDTADRERRYANIRSAHDSEEIEEDSSFTVTDEVDAFENAFNDDSFHLSETFSGQDAVAGESASITSSKSGSGQPSAKASNPTAKSKGLATSKQSRPSLKPNMPARLPKAKRRKLPRTSRSFSIGGADQWRLVGAIVLTLAMLGFLGLKAYRLYSGPGVRVIQGID